MHLLKGKLVMINEVYFDNAATTQVDESVINQMGDVMRNEYGNPSSLHTAGIKAKRIIDSARKSVADSLYCKHNEVIFTGGGSA